MQIVNLNKQWSKSSSKFINTWTNWKHYILDLDHEFSSLIGYILYFNPDYYLMPSGDFTNSQKKSYLSIITVSTSSGIIYPTVFLGYNLHYREGFINQETNVKYLLKIYRKDGVYYESDLIPFDTGYGCICQTQAVNQLDDENVTREFTIYPIGNGGFYLWNPLMSFENSTQTLAWIANYNSNDIGSFAASTTLNVSLTPLRYLVYNNNDGCDHQLSSHRLKAKDDDGNICIADCSENMWTGTNAIMWDLMCGEEELIDDVRYNIVSGTNMQYEKIAMLDIDTDEPTLENGYIQIW